MKTEIATVTNNPDYKIPMYTLEGLTFPVSVIAKKKVFGREVVLITPLNGAGTKWVNMAKIT